MNSTPSKPQGAHPKVDKCAVDKAILNIIVIAGFARTRSNIMKDNVGFLCLDASCQGSSMGGMVRQPEVPNRLQNIRGKPEGFTLKLGFAD